MNTILLILAAAALVCLLAVYWKRTPRFEFCNIAEGETETGNKTYLADAQIATRFFCVELGSDLNHIQASNSENDIPLGICTDAPDAAEDLCSVQVFGGVRGTIKGIANAAITLGDMLVSAGNGKLKTLPTDPGTYYIVGRALSAADADGDEIEFAPSFPIQRVVE